MIAYNGVLYQVRHLEKTDAQFRSALLEMCQRMDLDPTAMAAVISFESGFDPAIQNPYNKATGLIQFTRTNAERYGTSLDQLKAMSAIEQLPYVERHMKEVIGRVGASKVQAVSDVYMCVFWPIGVGKPEDSVLIRRGDKGWEGNKSLDQTGDGTITKAEASRYVVAIYNEAVRSGVVAAGTGAPPGTTPGETPPVVYPDDDAEAGAKVAVLGLGGFIGYMLTSLWTRIRSGRKG